MKNLIVFIILLIVSWVGYISFAQAMPNPAAAYCEEQGYKIVVEADEMGNEQGFCVFGNGKRCDEWEFFRGKCGQEYTNLNKELAGSVDTKCGIEQCHGLDVSCGTNVPEACTMIYKMGDYCRKFAVCEVIDGKCRIANGLKFNECKESFQRCSVGSDNSDYCEQRIRELFQ